MFTTGGAVSTTTTTTSTTTTTTETPRSPTTSPTATTTTCGYPDDEARSWPSADQPTLALPAPPGPSGSPMDNYPIEDDAPTVPEPAARTRKKKTEAQREPLTAGPGGGGSVHAAVAGPARSRAIRPRSAARPTTRWSRSSARCWTSSRSTPRSPAAPAVRPSPGTRSNSAPASRSRRSRRCRRTSPTPWRPRASGCSRRFPASPPSASRCPTPTVRWCGWPTC